MKYVKQEFADFHDKGTPQHYFKPVLEVHIHWEEMINRMRYHNQGLSEGEIVTVMEQLKKTLIELLAEGHSVEIGGIGNFTPTLGLKEGKEMDSLEGNETKRNAQSIKIDGINVAIDKKLVAEVDKKAHLELGGTIRLREKLFTKEEKLQKAKEFIQRCGAIRIADYMNLVNVSHTQASNELREFAKDTETGIRRNGRGCHIYYNMGQQNQ